MLSESGVEGAEVVGERSVVDAEGLRLWAMAGRWDWSVEDGPLVLEGAAVGWAFGEECGDFVGAAADAEAADGSLFNFGLRGG